jgi:hypothetical protein
LARAGGKCKTRLLSGGFEDDECPKLQVAGESPAGGHHFMRRSLSAGEPAPSIYANNTDTTNIR